MAQGKLKKKLSLADLFFLGVGSIIGSGWLYAAQRGAVVSGPDVWISWIIGAVIVILIGLVYAELSAALPRAGGFIRYPHFTHGSTIGFMIGFISMLAYSSVAAIEVEAVRGYAQVWWPALGAADGSPTVIGFLFQIAWLVLFFLINYWSVNVFGKSNTVVTIFKFLVPSLIIIFLFMHLDFDNFSVGGAKPGGLDGIFAAVTGAGIVFAFNGFRMPVEFAGEARRPQSDVPKAIILSVLAGLVIYLLLQFAFIGAVPDGKLAGGWRSVNFDSPWAGLASVLGLSWLANLVLIDAVISPSATGNIYFSATARTIFAWAKNETFYKWFQKIDKRTGLPRGALWLTFVLAILWMSPAQFQVWEGLVVASTSAKALTFVVGPTSLMALRKSAPEMKRPFYLKGASVLAPLAFLAATLVVYWGGWKVISFLIPIIVPSLLFYFAFVDRNEDYNGKVIGKHFKASLWLIFYYLFMFVMSYLGSFIPKSMEPAIIPAPWDTIICAAGALVFYYWGVQSSLSKPIIDDPEDE
ncbi:MAG TPA: APC family permease [Bacillales bacterium]|nr:APC family permease [Bacillales bacterium]